MQGMSSQTVRFLELIDVRERPVRFASFLPSFSTFFVTTLTSSKIALSFALARSTTRAVLSSSLRSVVGHWSAKLPLSPVAGMMGNPVWRSR